MTRSLLLATLLVGCAHRAPVETKPVRPIAVASASVAPTPRNVVGGNRSVEVFVPSSYREGTPAPVVLMLHAFGVNGALEEFFFRLQPHAQARGFLYVAPDGTPNHEGRTYWNATDACCAPELAKAGQPQPHDPDDETYLMGVIDEIASKYTVDPKRVFVVGHSNGGFMAHRLACEHAGRFAAIVSVAGATFADPARCPASAPVSLLQIHGTADATIRYEGGLAFGHPYPSARATAERWVGLDGCAPQPTPGSPMDIDGSLDGLETKVLRWGGCKANAAIELWTIEGGAHVPLPTTELARGIVDFLFAHPKP